MQHHGVKIKYLCIKCENKIRMFSMYEKLKEKNGVNKDR